MARKRKHAEGYAVEKAARLIAWERAGKKGKKPPMPRKAAERGAVMAWKKRLEEGYSPHPERSPKVHRRFKRVLIEKRIGKKRPFLRVGKIFFSMSYDRDIHDLVGEFIKVQYDDYGEDSERLLREDFDKDKFDDMISKLTLVRDRVGMDQPPGEWNREFMREKLDAEVWYRYRI